MTDQRGSATPALVGIASAFTLLAGIVLGVGSTLIVRAQLADAVDSAALAAADVSRGVVSGEPCSVAREVLHEAGAQMESCEEFEGSVVIQGRRHLGPQSVLATARAGVVDGGEK
jgi:secretion/DNA translocation related TadE-like protein